MRPRELRPSLLPRATAALLVALVAGSTACAKGAPASPAAVAPATAKPGAPKPEPRDEAAQAAKAADEASRALPSGCEKTEGAICLPPAAFVKRLCGGFYPDVALALFGKDTPWTRGYLTRATDAWNASGGVSSNDKLALDEEVLVLAQRRPDTGGMVVSGAGGGYDVLRWDGTCASLMTEEVRLQKPGKPRHAKVAWKSLGEATRNALVEDEKVGKVAAERRKECKGITMGQVSRACEKADALLDQVIVEYVRRGGALPAPGPLP